MIDYMDFFNVYIMGNVQVLTGFYFLTRLLQRKVKCYFYLLFVLVWTVFTEVIPTVRITEFLIYILLLTVSGFFVCHADCKSAILYSALTVEIMQLSYGIVNSLLSIFYPIMCAFQPKIVAIAFMLIGNIIALLLAVLCYYITYRYFSCYEAEKKQYVLMILTPILMIFLMEEYVNAVIYGNLNIIDDSGRMVYTKNYQMLAIQLLGMASLFCIMFVYKKLLQNFRLSTELSLLEQEEHSLNQYVEEAKIRYEKTKAFRHDVKNHISVVKELVQNGNIDAALQYISDMENLTAEMSFPVSTNNPVLDILIGNKLGIAKNNQIEVQCSFITSYPCGIADIDFCIIFSNALDNAISACNQMNYDNQKYIHITGKVQGDFLLIEISNSYSGRGSIRSGTGLANIKAVTEKYHGAMEIRTDGGIFALSVLLIIPQQSESISQQVC